MSCFLVVAGEAIVTTIAKKVIKSNEDKIAVANQEEQFENKHNFSHKLGWLNKMLWGGSGLLAFEHIWHGELSPFFPFLTAMSNPQDISKMLYEMSTVGVSMALLVTAVWFGIVLVSNRLENSSNVSKMLINPELEESV